MFKRLVIKVKEVLAKMGLIKSIGDVSEHKDIYVNEEMYNAIDSWKALYKGYFEDIHDIHYHTIKNGQMKRRMNTLNMPKIVSEEMASLVFNEKCDISVSDESLNDFLKSVFKKNKLNKKLQDFIEYTLAFGGGVIKPYVENDQIKISFVTADCFLPLSYSNESIKEAVFVNEWRKGQDKFTHLEWHVWEKDLYVVINEVYKAQNGEDLGIKVNLSTVFPNLEERVEVSGLQQPMFAYFKPNIANNIDTQSPLGVSIFSNAIDTIKAIDTAFDSFEREFRLGKKRIIVPNSMVKTTVDPKTGELHRYFDDSDETYEAVDYEVGDNQSIKDIKVELRVDEHISAINALLNLFAMQTGFSSGSFSFDGESMKTATEVVSEQSKTFKSKKSHETIIESGLQELIDSIVELAQLYGIYNAPNDFDVVVSFDDSIVEDKLAELTNLIQEVNNRLTPRKQAIMKYHGLTEEEAEKWMAEINEESASVNQTQVDFFGTGGGNNGE